ncbi:hypothetical protein [Rhizobium binxianense]
MPGGIDPPAGHAKQFPPIPHRRRSGPIFCYRVPLNVPIVALVVEIEFVQRTIHRHVPTSLTWLNKTGLNKNWFVTLLVAGDSWSTGGGMRKEEQNR